jgi:hypothetical protein
MAHIVIHGTPKKISSYKIREAACFFSDHLLKRLSKNVKIVIKLKNNLYRKTKCFGYAIYTDEDVRPDRHREFEIEMESDMGPVFMIRTLAHELVHVKQYARGELNDSCYGNYQKWQGVMYNEQLISYKDLPWEKEALQLERELYHLWKQHVN